MPTSIKELTISIVSVTRVLIRLFVPVRKPDCTA